MEEVRPHEVTSQEQAPIKEAPGIGAALPLQDKPENVQLDAEGVEKEKKQLIEVLQRSQADFINFKRRTEEEREEQQKYANSRLILKLLPVLDEFRLAIDHASPQAGSAWLEGIKLVQRKFQSLLESENITKINADGKYFDPFEHEAIAYQESRDHEEGQIIAVVRDGYKLHDRVIRHAVVLLAKRPDPG